MEEKTYRIVDYVNNYEFTGWMGKRYTDLDIARFWAIHKSEEMNAIVALYTGCDCMVEKRDGNSSWYNECNFRAMSIGDGINWMRNTLNSDNEWKERLAESAEKKAA